ncbi:MAG TPA: glycosyltransferase, partial [Pirellulaceae bacterium]|nr:glycosyltransferase [Pirellulaceae bacterium]
MAPLMLMVAFTVFLLAPWMSRVDLHDPVLTALCLSNTAVWWIVLWWSLHHLTFKVGSLFRSDRGHALPQAAASGLRMTVLYPTCNDFQWQACHSCVSQDYSAAQYQVVICDDSSSESYRKRIDEFQRTFPEVIVLRRNRRQGFKAGNLNHALASAQVTGEWLIIVDADQILPQHYVSQFAGFVAGLPDRVGYAQARQESDHVLPTSSSHFQQALGREIDIFYSHDLALRSEFGFMPLVGHGAALRRTAWQQVPFPEVVSEDFAMSLEMRNRDLVGAYAPEVQAWESFPPSFGAFLIRLRKFAGGTAELYRKHLPAFLFGPATFTEKLDLLMMIGWYALM